ncbi:IdeS/Mac family cysteine endopeptidase [Bacteroides hominis]|uniref:IdeS/Mac family cysteine endopeptidase n=1 Tax=Bacteroides hominis TaxID=2763023 RepID=UPI003D6C063E
MKEFSDFVVTGLKERGVVGLGLLGHVTTIWGATYNTETGLVKSIVMADSDDRHDGKLYHGLWENLSVKERSDGRVVLGSGKLIETAVVLYAYPGKTD